MKLTQLAATATAVIAATLTLTGCSDMVSLHPFVAEKEAVVDSRLNGVWFDDDDMYVIRQEDKGYAIAYSDKKGSKVYKLEALMIKVGDAQILDLLHAAFFERHDQAFAELVGQRHVRAGGVRHDEADADRIGGAHRLRRHEGEHRRCREKLLHCRPPVAQPVRARPDASFPTLLSLN